MKMTAVLTNANLLRFQVEGSMLDFEFVVLFPLNAFLQGALKQWMEKLGLSF